jgi:uncharacterized protein (DUF4415 family)
MGGANPILFTRLADGSLLRRQPDGSFRVVDDKTDRARLAALSDAEIERMAASDADHPPLDDAFWSGVENLPRKEAISIKLDDDVLAFFRGQGRGYQTRINAVLRRYMQSQRKTG